MSLSDRMDKVKVIFNPDEQPDVHVIVTTSYQTKDEALQEYKKTIGKKISVNDYFIYVTVYPEEYGHKEMEFIKRYNKQIDFMFKNQNYSIDRIIKKYINTGL